MRVRNRKQEETLENLNKDRAKEYPIKYCWVFEMLL